MSRRAITLLLAVAAVILAAGSPAAAQPGRIGGLIPDLPTGARAAHAYAPRSLSLSYGGGPVLHFNRTHVIFWEPAGSGLSFEPGYEPLIERFLTQVAADSHSPANVYGLSGQYHDAFGPAAYASSYGGAVVDSSSLPPTGCSEPPTGPAWTACVTDIQIEAEVQRVVQADRLPRTASNVYFLVTPSGLADCIEAGSSNCALGGSGTGYCGYHSQTPDGLHYAVIPYNAVPGHCQSQNPRPNASPADPAISTISHEHNEMVTDPEEDAWIDSLGEEDGDLCIQSFGPVLGGSGEGAWNEVIHGAHYYLQEEWSNVDGGCEPRATADRISISRVSSPAQAARRLRFTGSARASHGSIVAYNWFFGDGTGANGRTPAHVYRRPGAYRVVLRTTDSWDNWALYARTVRVARAPRVGRRG
ncbi:MAG: PKD domain-containing protein [Solirubrobacterales bacterium]|nr:PKD domain-containing protein [Solirubrobacterales bacterium]MBV9716595.1 PKD domain-containing protein [Solirubrobacterales bacterium]